MKSFAIAFLLLLASASTSFAGEVHLSAAASLKEVINELSDKYASKHPGTVFVKNYGASGVLAGQIENGAPADLFISANEKWVDYLKTKNILDKTSTSTFAWNALVVVGNPQKKVSSMDDLKKLEKIGIGSPKSVPAGEYALEALKNAGLDQTLSGKLVMAKDVRECLMYAEIGEVDASFVYLTDALQLAKNAKILFTVPQKSYSRVSYPMGLTVSGAANKEVAEFYSYLQGSEAKAVLRSHGFSLK